MSSKDENQNKIENELPQPTNSHRDITLTENKPKQKEESIIHKKEEIITKNNDSKNKFIIQIILFSCFSVLIIIGIVFLIGHYVFHWFKKKQNLVVEINREENLVMRYLEVKNSTNYYDIEGISEQQKRKDDSLVTDLIVGINKKTKIENLDTMDYLYQAYLLIVNITKINDTDFENLGGINIYDKTKSIDELIQANNNLFNINNTNDNYTNIPLSKFYFYENGTIEDIYFPLNTNEFYKSVILDLIEKAIPKFSDSLYNIKDNKRRLEKGDEGIYLNYEKTNDENGKEINTILYEDKLEKNINNDSTFDNSELNSNIKRVFNSSGDMVDLEMKGQAIFKSNQKEEKKTKIIENVCRTEKIIKTNISYYRLGYNQFKMNVSSKMKLLQNKKNPKILETLDNFAKKINFENSKFSNSTPETEKINEIQDEDEDEEINNKNNIKSNEKRKLINNQNYPKSYQITYNLMTTSFLGLSIGINQGLYINNKTGLRKGHIDVLLGENKYTLSYLNYYYVPFDRRNGTITRSLLEKELEGPSKNFKIFGYLISADLNFNFNVNHGLRYGIINGELFTQSFSDFDINIEGSFGPKFIVFSFGVALTGHIVSGEAYIQANTLVNSNSNLARVEYYKEINSCAVDISFYFSIYLLFYEKKFSKDIRIYDGFSDFENYYNDV